jgi:hypothetical protein
MPGKLSPSAHGNSTLAYAPAMLAAVKSAGPWTGTQSQQDYAVETTMRMIELIERAGVEAAAYYYYYLNAQGGAFAATCQALGIPNTVGAIETYLGGGK